MALLDKGLKQRIVGALVLLALAVIFLPMLLNRQDEARHVVVEAPAMPQTPAMPEIVPEPVVVAQPEPEPEAQPPLPVEPPVVATAPTPAEPVRPSPPAKPPVTTPPPAQPKPAPTRLDASGLPVSWSVQLASLSNRAGAENLQKTLRGQGYNAYIRSADGMNRVFVGPVIERTEAERLRDQINRQHKLSGFVVRFQPERR